MPHAVGSNETLAWKVYLVNRRMLLFLLSILGANVLGKLICIREHFENPSRLMIRLQIYHLKEWPLNIIVPGPPSRA